MSRVWYHAVELRYHIFQVSLALLSGKIPPGVRGSGGIVVFARVTSLSFNRLALSSFCSCLMSVQMELFRGSEVFRALFLCCIYALSMVFR